MNHLKTTFYVEDVHFVPTFSVSLKSAMNILLDPVEILANEIVADGLLG